MSPPIWTLVLVPIVIFLFYWGRGGDRSPKAPAVAPVPEDLAEALGEPLAAWLLATRELRGAVVMLEQRARVQLDHERPPAKHHGLAREIGHAELQAEIFNVRKQGEAWRKLATALADPERARLAAFGIDLDELLAHDSLLALPWRVDHDVDYVRDRSGEMETIVAGCVVASSVLSKLDGRLSAVVRAPYR